jgi:hypothetical protein
MDPRGQPWARAGLYNPMRSGDISKDGAAKDDRPRDTAAE